MIGTIFNIQRFSIHDGPGIRTTVFFKGCNLRCFWCHNPESARMQPDIQFFPSKCIACGRCVEVCEPSAQRLDPASGAREFLRDLCTDCRECTSECFAEALVLSGQQVSVEDIFQKVEQDRPYYNGRQGGVTFSGGEPLLQVEFLTALLERCKAQEIHTAVDTAGNIPWENLAAIMPLTDLFLFDCKVFDEEKHRQATGVGNQRILDNLARLARSGAEIWIRIPVIPGVNDNEAEFERIADFLAPLPGIRKVELMPFHHLGAGKFESLGRLYPTRNFQPPSGALMERLRAVLSFAKLETTIAN
ncbi:MAG: glycyl-radical enzyme activating protein [Chloroflexota bacterium]